MSVDPPGQLPGALVQAVESSLVFLDTNIFVYAFVTSEPLKRARALQLIEACLGSGKGCISYQVIQEFSNVACKKFAARMSASDCKAFIDAAMQPMNRVASSTELVHAALDLQSELRFGFYDSLMVAAALQAGAETLYTEDLQHWQWVRGSLRIVNPFLETVHEA
jgi:predicted nucleic acid-binding protein